MSNQKGYYDPSNMSPYSHNDERRVASIAEASVRARNARERDEEDTRKRLLALSSASVPVVRFVISRPVARVVETEEERAWRYYQAQEAVERRQRQAAEAAEQNESRERSYARQALAGVSEPQREQIGRQVRSANRARYLQLPKSTRTSNQAAWDAMSDQQRRQISTQAYIQEWRWWKIPGGTEIFHPVQQTIDHAPLALTGETASRTVTLADFARRQGHAGSAAWPRPGLRLVAMAAAAVAVAGIVVSHLSSYHEPHAPYDGISQIRGQRPTYPHVPSTRHRIAGSLIHRPLTLRTP